MPIQLTTPIQTGAIDPDGPYTQAKIIRFSLDSIQKYIELYCQYGNTVDGVWVPGIQAGVASNKYFYIRDSDYNTLIAAHSEAADEVYYDKVKEQLYQWLIDNDYFIGTIV